MLRRGLLLSLVIVLLIVVASCNFFDQKGTLKSINITPVFPFVATGATATFTATGVNDDGSTASLGSITWDTGDHSIATITGTSTGTATAVIATGAGPVLGHTTVTATTGAGGISGSTTMSVTGSGQDLQSITVDTNPAGGAKTVSTTTPLQLAATGHFLGAAPTADISTLVQWTSSDTTLATVDSTGRVTAVKTGNSASVTITVTSGSTSVPTTVTVL